MNIADEIKNRLSMEDIFERYGFEPNRAGFIPCPFHAEKTPSLSAYAEGRRWKCFGCGAQGSVIDFVMQLYGIDCRQALIRIDNDFGLYLLSASGGRRDGIRERRRKAAEKAARSRQRAALLAEMNGLCEMRRALWQLRLNDAPKTPDEPLSPAFVLALHNIDALDARIWELYEIWKGGGEHFTDTRIHQG